MEIIIGSDHGGHATKEAIKIAKIFLTTPFSGIPRHKRRIQQIKRMER